MVDSDWFGLVRDVGSDTLLGSFFGLFLTFSDFCLLLGFISSLSARDL